MKEYLIQYRKALDNDYCFMTVFETNRKKAKKKFKERNPDTRILKIYKLIDYVMEG